jgi:ESS family glutamate:Na+ symporter
MAHRSLRLKPVRAALPSREPVDSRTASADLLPAVLVIGVAMGLGNLLSLQMERLGLIRPGYIGAMVVAAVIRNVDDRWHFARIRQADIDKLGKIALYLFFVMALLTLRLWELAHLALLVLIPGGAGSPLLAPLHCAFVPGDGR